MDHDQRIAKEGFDTSVIEMDAQAMSNQAAGDTVEDAGGLEPAGARHTRDNFGEIRRAPWRQSPQARQLAGKVILW